MAHNFRLDYLPVFAGVRAEWCIMMGVLIISHLIPRSFKNWICDMFVRMPWVLKLVCFLVVVQLVVEYMSEEVTPFIYFQF